MIRLFVATLSSLLVLASCASSAHAVPTFTQPEAPATSILGDEVSAIFYFTSDSTQPYRGVRLETYVLTGDVACAPEALVGLKPTVTGMANYVSRPVQVAMVGRPQAIGPATFCGIATPYNLTIDFPPVIEPLPQLRFVVNVAPSPKGSTLEEVRRTEQRERREAEITRQTGRPFCTMPEVQGMTLRRAQVLLRDAGCTVARSRLIYSAKVKKGRVIRSGVTAGKRTNAPIRLTVSRGARPARS